MTTKLSSTRHLAWLVPLTLILVFFFYPKPIKISLSKEYEACTTSSNTPSQTGLCLQQLAGHLNRGYNVNDVETVIKSITDQERLQWCHEFAHYVGWEIFQGKKNLAASFSVASGTCDSGMYHGIMEEYIKDIGIGYDTDDFLNVVIPRACDDVISSPLVPAAMVGLCYHGLGHAFMVISDNDLNRSLQLCDRMDDSVEQGCYTGSLMENIQSKQVGIASPHPKKFAFNAQDMDYPCNVLESKYKHYCYFYKGVSNVVEEKGDFRKAFENCLKIDPDWESVCFFGVGANIPGPHWPHSTAAGKCKAALDISDEAYRQCVLGAMSFVVQLSLGNGQGPVDFCEIIEQEYKDLCYDAAGKNLSGWVTPKESLEEKCSLFQSAHAKEICQFGSDSR